MDDPAEPRPAPDPEELALEFLVRRGAGESMDLDLWLARLPDEPSRREFLALVQASQRVERALPQPPRALEREQLVAGRYWLLRQLGAGGMGQVWEAEDRELGRRVALKFLDRASQGRPEREELFRKESRLLASLQHPGIVAVHEFGRDGELAFIAMDLVPGRSLAEVLDTVRALHAPRDARQLEAAIGERQGEGRPDLLEGGDWFRAVARIELELARTIEAAHGAKVVHRDLKPSNVMLTAGGSPVVLDFGLAGSADGLKGAVTQGLYGSVAYLAPEQARSHAVGTDPRTDVYQLGLVLYEMLTLQRTFPGHAIGELLERIQQGRFELPSALDARVPRELEAICLRAVELDPARRYPSARALREDLERWLGGHELPHALGAGRLRRALRRVRWQVRQRPWLSLATGLALAALAAWLLWPGAPLDFRPTPLRFDDQRGVPVLLAEGERTARTGDWLGFRVRTNKTVHVWTLSVFGARAAPERVSPWHASTPETVGRNAGEFGLELPPGEHVVLGPHIQKEAEEIEGLLLLVSEDPREHVENWFTLLRQKQGQTGLTWAEANALGEHVVDRERSVQAGAPSDAERARVAAGFQHPGAGGVPVWEALGVRAYPVQCLTR